MTKAKHYPNHGSAALEPQVIGSFSSFPEAERALSDLGERVPADKLQVVGQGLQSLPRGPGTSRSLVEAGIAGSAVGALAMLVVALTSGDVFPDSLTLRALLLGGVCGFFAGLAAAATAPISLPPAEPRLYARRYDVVADRTVAVRAMREIESRELDLGTRV